MSVPVGDRNEPPAFTGPAAVRDALDHAAPPTFAAQVVAEATEAGWLVNGGPPTLYLVKGDTLIVAHVSPATGYQANEWLHRLRRVSVVKTEHWKPSDGLDQVRAALREAAGPGRAPLGDPDAGRRGD